MTKIVFPSAVISVRFRISVHDFFEKNRILIDWQEEESMSGDEKQQADAWVNKILANVRARSYLAQLVSSKDPEERERLQGSLAIFTANGYVWKDEKPIVYDVCPRCQTTEGPYKTHGGYKGKEKELMRVCRECKHHFKSKKSFDD